MERKVGEIFEYNGEWYQCVEGTGCYKCAFYDKNICIANNPHCTCRSDKKNVIFKKLEKVGEPHFIYDKIFKGGKVYVQNFMVYEDFKNHKPICDDYVLYDWHEKIISIEIKQNKEDMEEKKIKLSQDDIDWLKKQIRWAALPGYITDEEDYDRATEEIMNLFIPSDTEHPSSEKIGKNLKPFDLEAAKAGKPVCTRDGRKARIISFDLNNKNFPIVAIINCDTEENAYQYDIDGVCDEHDNNLNLMMSPEKKEGWVNVYKSYNVGKKIPCMASIYPTKEEAKKSSVVGFDYVDTVKIEWEE
ncbi:hypothetical protein [Barnesiella intestinihominis]|uniref:hypothetical protein n=1 Tax=Barnesiella intestinihominis TaxID=487174 RepID=UPI001898066B|nr:hypothetical protein [Barnesiella intestinihominis]MDB0676088.1 hypothetical protein [Barnesiella intestinihominis]